MSGHTHIHTYTHTNTQDNYSNPRCACAPRVNWGEPYSESHLDELAAALLWYMCSGAY